MAYTNTGIKQSRNLNAYIIFTSLITISIILSILIVSPLSSEDPISIYRGFSLFILGLTFFATTFSFINYIGLKTPTGFAIRKKFHLTPYDILDISNKIVSLIQAILSCISGTIVCLYSCSRSFLHTSHFASEAYAWFGTSYFLYDIWSMYKVHACQNSGQQENGDCVKKPVEGLREFKNYMKTQPIIVAHHLFIGSFGFLVIVYLRGGLGDCIFGYMYLMEASTPFVSLRGVLSRIGMKSSKLYVWNGIIMIITFFLCRIIMFPYVCYLHAQAANMKFFEAIMSLPRGCKISIILLYTPQIYWFWLMVRGAAKIVCEPKSNNHIAPRKRRSANHNHS